MSMKENRGYVQKLELSTTKTLTALVDWGSIKYFSHLAQNLLGGEGFLKKWHPGIQHSMMDDGLVRVPRHEESLCVLAQRT